jgi:hypothetical protein
MSWFEALGVDRDDVARVGYNLAAYAREHEVDEPDRPDEGEPVLERRLMRATTLLDAASLLVLINAFEAGRLLRESASLFEQADAPEAWTVGLACWGAWQPSPSSARPQGPARPTDAIASLAALFYDQELERGDPNSAWQVARSFGDNPSIGYTVTGIPARLFREFADHARRNDLLGALDSLEQIIRRADETIRDVQQEDNYHWRRFVAEVPLLDPVLLALAGVAARVDGLVDEMHDSPLTPARVTILSGARIGEDLG